MAQVRPLVEQRQPQPLRLGQRRAVDVDGRPEHAEHAGGRHVRPVDRHTAGLQHRPAAAQPAGEPHVACGKPRRRHRHAGDPDGPQHRRPADVQQKAGGRPVGVGGDGAGRIGVHRPGRRVCHPQVLRRSGGHGQHQHHAGQLARRPHQVGRGRGALAEVQRHQQPHQHQQPQAVPQPRAHAAAQQGAHQQHRRQQRRGAHDPLQHGQSSSRRASARRRMADSSARSRSLRASASTMALIIRPMEPP